MLAVVLAVLIGAAFVAVTVLDTDEASAEVILEPIGTAPRDAFTDPVAPVPSASLRDYAEGTGPAGDVVPDGRRDGAGEEDGGYATVDGDARGLYGGSLDEAACEVEELISFLEAEPAKAEAWAAVQGIRVEQIRPFIESLTPVNLGADTRVLNHGFADGEATPRESVLQRGTAVLVDDRGVPRANCYCGNPLLEPTVTAEETYVGDPWESFEPAEVVRVDAAPASVEAFELVDVDTGSTFRRPPGTGGDSDEAGDSADDGPTEPPPSPTPSPTPTTPEPSPSAVQTAPTPPCTDADTRLEPEVPDQASRVEEAAGDLDADGAADRIITYAIESDDRLHFSLRVITAAGYVVEVPLDEADEIAPVSPLGAIHIGAERPVAAIIEQTGASSRLVSLWALHDFREQGAGPCALAPVETPGPEVQRLFPDGGSLGGGGGLECRDWDGDGVTDLVVSSYTRSGEEEWTWTQRGFTWPGAGALRGLGEESGTVTSQSELASYTGLDCPGLESS